MSEVQRIADQLRRAHQGEAWHGPALEETLAGVSAGQAAARPIAKAHTMWEIVQHISVWENVIRRRLSGEVVVDLSPEQDWPAISDSSEAAWKRTREDLERGLEELQQVIARLDDRRLSEPVPGLGYDVYFMLHGAVQHALYHAGQIALLKRALE
jgi:uncharacterized damage-inducible protein DinB